MSDNARDEALEIMQRLEPIMMQLVRDVSEIKGQQSDLLSWMQSMDHRLVALVHP